MPSFSEWVGMKAFCWHAANDFIPAAGLQPKPFRSAAEPDGKASEMKYQVPGSRFQVCTRPLLVAAILLGALLPSSLHAQFASSVVNYAPGTGAGTLADPNSALGEPSRVTPGQFGGPVDPFNSPYLSSQIVTIGDGGSLTVGFASPVFNNPANPFGLDFLIFGNSGFVITNGDFGGGGITDGTLYGAGTGNWRVSVSGDGSTFYSLAPSFAPAFDNLYPTDGQGNFGLPVNPALKGSDFAGLGISGFRNLYAGSGGGAGYDMAWARDQLGQPVALASASFVRIESLGGIGQIDGFSAVVPEPGALVLAAAGAMALLLNGRWRR
jgi:hypothetical protein